MAQTPDRYAELPDRVEIHAWDTIREFCETVRPAGRRDRLLAAIQGRGAFRYFKDLAAEYGILEQWYAFEEEALRRIARAWCEEEGIAYKDERRMRVG